MKPLNLYKPVKDREINRLRNILAALVNLETQTNDMSKDFMYGIIPYLHDVARVYSGVLEKRIKELSKKSRGRRGK